jgi:hypothetical protein
MTSSSSRSNALYSCIWEESRQSVWAAAAVMAFALASIPAHSTPLRQGGVSLEVKTLPDRVLLCVNSDGEHKISSQFGIEFNADKGSDVWEESFPKIVEGPDWYFALPLRIDLKTRGNPAGQHLRIELGACSAKRSLCNKIEFLVIVPPMRSNESEECSSQGGS